MENMFLVLVHATSKWLEVEMVDRVTSANTIEELCKIFATHVVPKGIVSDNDSLYTSNKMKEFFKKNNIRHICTDPFQPSSNGMAESYKQTFKKNYSENYY